MSVRGFTIDCTEEHLTNMVAHHWMIAPQLYNLSCYLLTFVYLSNASLHVPGHSVGWLNLITHTLLCPITCKLDLSDASLHVPGHLVGWLNLITHTLLCPITCKLDSPGQLIMFTN